MNSGDKLSSQKPETIELKIPAKTEYINVVRLSIAGIGERMGFSVDDIEDIKIVVGEACINSIRYAYQGEKSGKNLICIRFLIHPTKLEIIVNDSGKGFDTSRIDKYLKEPGDGKIDGIGLGVHLMKTLMDEVEYNSSSGATKVRIVKNK